MTAIRTSTADRLLRAMSVCLLFAIGCGRSPELAAVSGSVSFEGQPVNEGAMRLMPKDGTPGGGLGVLIHDGKYHVSIEQKLPAGAYYVAITATRPTGKQVRRYDVKPGESTTMPEVVQYIPPKYNDDLSLTLELPGGESQRDFDLK